MVPSGYASDALRHDADLALDDLGGGDRRRD